jgi:hypothetical protein
MTHKIVITWATHQDQTNPALDPSRSAKLMAMTGAGQTDQSKFFHISPTVTQRDFVDAESAQEYGDFLVSETSALKIPSPTFVVSPL